MSGAAPYTGIIFSSVDMRTEIDNMRLLAKGFLEPDSYERVIPAWKRHLETFMCQPPGAQTKWEIREDDAIKTVHSEGHYEKRGRKGKTVFGEVSGVWDIRIPSLPRTKKQKATGTKSFVLLGLASIVIKVKAKSSGDEIVKWTLDVGDHDSPGCHFHTQLGGEIGGQQFPVPRLPTLLHTPMDALEFLLSEIFQSKWAQHASQVGLPAVQIWSKCQRERLVNLLNWQKSEIEQARAAPWTLFKGKKPPANLFFSEARD